MKGSYKVTVRNKYAKYEFVLRRKYTLLVGDSATGKSMLYKMLGEKYTSVSVSALDGDKNVKVVALPGRKDTYLDILPSTEPRIFVVDEDIEDIENIEFKRLMERSNAYFVLMSRKLLHYKVINSSGKKIIEPLPLSINEIYRISSNVKRVVGGREYYENKFVNRYNIYDESPKIDIVLSEDSGSGSKIYGSCYKGAELVTANGNGSVARRLKFIDNRNYGKCIAVFVDGAAYGVYIDELIALIGCCKNRVILYAPESLEWLLLRAIPPKLYIYPFNNDILLNPQNYCDKDAFKKLVFPYNQYDERKFESWEQLFTNYLTYLMSKTNFNAPYTKSATISDFYLKFGKEILSIIENEL